MNKLIAFAFATLILITSSASFAFTEAEKVELKQIIADYIRNNPETLVSTLEKHAQAQAEADAAKANERLAEMPKGLDYPLTPTAGAADADVTIVEFFDYNCGYCKRVLPDVTNVLETDKKVKVIFKELPILSPASETAARYAIASNKQGKYMELHSAFTNHSGRLDETKIKELAQGVGLDVAKLETDAQSQDVTDALAHNMSVAQELGVRGTPFFLIGKQKVPGAVGFTRMQSIISEERNATN